MELRAVDARSAECHSAVLTAITTAPMVADELRVNEILSAIKMLIGVVAFALGLVRWYNTPEARQLLASIK